MKSILHNQKTNKEWRLDRYERLRNNKKKSNTNIQ